MLTTNTRQETSPSQQHSPADSDVFFIRRRSLSIVTKDRVNNLTIAKVIDTVFGVCGIQRPIIPEIPSNFIFQHL
ncbi:hypothetical protein L596_012864 [Steinernema carpocapsae]|uniref:Uncharacterized protein n=1 Tax=Steinernema carpocapsae TaxID=34508 RepID=A0A4U5NYI6_STECR|nr:hypothetical protein L596_012864 [Steinernema carpocapsae]